MHIAPVRRRPEPTFVDRLFLLRSKTAPGARPVVPPAPVPSDDWSLPADSWHPRLSQCHEFIETVDVWQLPQLRWPIMGTLAPGYVSQLELNHYLRRLLAGGRWRNVQAAPHVEDGRRDQHRFDLYGEPRSRRPIG